jgi:hypothetical protein
LGARRNPYQRLVATVMTIIVVTLLPVAHFSRTSTYDYGVNPTDRPVWSAASLDDVAQRIRIVIGSSHADAPQPNIDVMREDPATHRSTQQSVRVEKSAPQQEREVAAELAAALFALFGLFVLWWGRDRAALWLGVFCASFGTMMIQFYGALPELAMFAAAIVATTLEFVSMYALYALAEVVTLEVLARHDPVRKIVRVAGNVVLGIIGFTAAIELGRMLLPVVFRVTILPELTAIQGPLTTFSIVVTLCAAPLVLLATASLRAAEPAGRKKAIVIFATTLAALSGVIYSIAHQWNPPQFDTSWFTLLAIPIGFIVTIRAYQVVEVKVVISRILVVTAMTAIIGAAIALSETFVHGMAEERVASFLQATTTEAKAHVSWALEFLVAFVIVVSFSNLHHFLDELFKRIVFRKRDEAVEALHDFAAHRASSFSARRTLLRQAVELVKHELCACGAAIYEESAAGYDLAERQGAWAWPECVDVDDPVFVTMRTELERVDLGEMRATRSALGAEGYACRMAVGGRVIGTFVIGPREREQDGPYVREELVALDDMARGVADALFNLRAGETAIFVRAVAEGSVGGEEARRRAEALRERGLAGFEAPLRRPVQPPPFKAPV